MPCAQAGPCPWRGAAAHSTRSRANQSRVLLATFEHLEATDPRGISPDSFSQALARARTRIKRL